MSRSSPSVSQFCRPLRVTRLCAAFWAVEDALRTRAADHGIAIASPGSTSAAALAGAAHPMRATDRTRVLRWLFTRGDERLTCELALSSDTAWYELRTMPSAATATETLERFTDATAAFERQSSLEGALVSDGWSLDAYESLVVERPVEPPATVQP